MKKRSGAKRTREQRQIDLHRISQYLFMGGDITQKQIAELINSGRPESDHISRSQVTRDIGKLRDEWAEQRVDNMDFLVNRELARLDHLEARLWEVLGISEKHRKEIIRSNAGDSEKDIVEDLPPNPAIFDKIISVQKERRKLLGLYSTAVNLVQNIEVKGYEVVSPDDWDDGRVVEGSFSKLADGKE